MLPGQLTQSKRYCERWSCNEPSQLTGQQSSNGVGMSLVVVIRLCVGRCILPLESLTRAVSKVFLIWHYPYWSWSVFGITDAGHEVMGSRTQDEWGMYVCAYVCVASFVLSFCGVAAFQHSYIAAQAELRWFFCCRASQEVFTARRTKLTQVMRQCAWTSFRQEQLGHQRACSDAEWFSSAGAYLQWVWAHCTRLCQCTWLWNISAASVW